MLYTERNKKKPNPLVRWLLMILLILLSKNVEMEITSPDWEVKFSTDSLSLQAVTKLIELF
ncbi:MAG: hypothetical protein F6K21_05030 [Symploca sp. SIO2D2]|nr:hypothetical protein [Symploca sp. SIO2D2]